MRTFSLSLLLALSFLCSNQLFAVKSLSQNSESSVKIKQKLDQKINHFLYKGISHIQNLEVQEIIKPKKKKRRKKRKNTMDRLKLYLWGAILSYLGSAFIFVIGYIIAIFSAIAGGAATLGAILLLFSSILSVVALVFFVLWCIETTKRLLFLQKELEKVKS